MERCLCDNPSDGREVHYQNCPIAWSKQRPNKNCPKNEDGTISLQNDNLKGLDCDVLYHLGMDTQNHDLPKMFGDIKFVCMGGTKQRMKEFAIYVADLLEIPLKGRNLVNLTKHSHRYAMYKVGSVLSVSHGIGIPSMTVLLQEIFKLLCYAKAIDPIIFRIGTSGGLKVPPGSVVVSSWGLNGLLEKTYNLPVLGEMRQFPAIFDKRLSEEVMELANRREDDFETFIGGTMAADDFYRGQARLDGPTCDHSEEEKLNFLKKLCELGVRNIEMEATAFSAMTSEAGFRSADVCVTFLDRMQGDQVTTSKETLLQWQARPMDLVGRYILRCIRNYKQ